MEVLPWQYTAMNLVGGASERLLKGGLNSFGCLLEISTAFFENPPPP